MTFEEIFADNGSIWLVAKAFYLLAFTLYFIFTLIVWKQISLMAKTLSGSKLPLQLIGMSVSLIALLALITAFIIL